MSLCIYKTFNFSIDKAVTTIKSTPYFVTAPHINLIQKHLYTADNNGLFSLSDRHENLFQ